MSHSFEYSLGYSNSKEYSPGNSKSAEYQKTFHSGYEPKVEKEISQENSKQSEYSFSDGLCWRGITKKVQLFGDYIIKVFTGKQDYIPTQEELWDMIRIKELIFGSFLIRTELLPDEKYGYVIRQPQVKGKTLSEYQLKDLDIDILKDLLILIDLHIKYYELGYHIDIMGCQKGAGDLPKIIRYFKNFRIIPKNFLTSTNIMVGNTIDDPTNRLYIVDVCDDKRWHFLGDIKNIVVIQFFLWYTRNKIKQCIAQKEKIATENQ